MNTVGIAIVAFMLAIFVAKFFSITLDEEKKIDNNVSFSEKYWFCVIDIFEPKGNSFIRL